MRVAILPSQRHKLLAKRKTFLAMPNSAFDENLENRFFAIEDLRQRDAFIDYDKFLEKYWARLPDTGLSEYL